MILMQLMMMMMQQLIVVQIKSVVDVAICGFDVDAVEVEVEDDGDNLPAHNPVNAVFLS